MAHRMDASLQPFHLPGEYARLITQERRRVTEVDPRGWFLTDGFDESAYQAAQAQAAANPKRSPLLDALNADLPVEVDRRALSREFHTLKRNPHAPAWVRDPYATDRIRLTPEDILTPVPGEAPRQN